MPPYPRGGAVSQTQKPYHPCITRHICISIHPCCNWGGVERPGPAVFSPPSWLHGRPTPTVTLGGQTAPGNRFDLYPPTAISLTNGEGLRRSRLRHHHQVRCSHQSAPRSCPILQGSKPQRGGTWRRRIGTSKQPQHHCASCGWGWLGTLLKRCGPDPTLGPATLPRLADRGGCG